MAGRSSWLFVIRVIARIWAWRRAVRRPKAITIELLQKAQGSAFLIIQAEALAATREILQRERQLPLDNPYRKVGSGGHHPN